MAEGLGWGGFLLASLLLGLAPGPDNLYVLSQSARQGWGTGLAITLGLCTGLVLHTAAVALGVAALLAASPWALNLLKGAGAAYLLYLALGALRGGTPPEPRQSGSVPRLYARQAYLRGVLMNLSNPKVLLFFLAFLPQFVDPLGRPAPLQLLGLGGAFILVTLVLFTGLSLLAGSLAGRLGAGSSAGRWLDRLTACLFVALALRLVTG